MVYMANEGGERIINDLYWDNPYRIRSWRELINWNIEEGFENRSLSKSD